eukprot:m.38385 g.38385  ORF g.38385 m.38385 type:complete len:243 (+) comp5500_c0_seq3:473-1201(+)
MATQAEKEAVVQEILDFFQKDGQYGVETCVTQMEHACQAAKKAVDAGSSEDLIIAALLHDIGWKLAMAASVDSDVPNGSTLVSEESLAQRLGILTVCNVGGASLEQQRAQHDVVGAAFLRMRGFREEVAHLIEGHVLAKRYFCYKDPAYRDGLSEGSKRTLQFQGGPMTAEEALIFEKDPLFEDCMRLRRWDESAKVPDLAVPPMESYREMMLRTIANTARTAKEIQSCYMRSGNTLVGVAA